MTTSRPTVTCDRLSCWFGKVVAVSDVTLELHPGVTALLGPNGAGKSTLMRMLSGAQRPSNGSLAVLGSSPRSSARTRNQIGLIAQHEAAFERLTAAQMVATVAALHGVDQPSRAAARTLEQVHLEPRLNRPLSAYSAGMRQRVRIAAALVHQPAVLMADEPLRALDPLERRRVIALLRELGEAGVTVLVSSHVLDEVERIGSDVIVIAKGRLVARGDYRELRKLMDSRPMETAIRTDKPRELASALVGTPGVAGVELEPDGLTVSVTDPPVFGRQVASVAQSCGAALLELQPADESLEDVFTYIVEDQR